MRQTFTVLYTWLPWVLILGSLGGCQSNAYETLFAKDRPNIAAQYAQKAPQQHYGKAAGQMTGYMRTAENELQNLFPELPNPRLLVFVFPHLTDHNHPVPGYSTAFYLYEQKSVFALPGEMPALSKEEETNP